MKKAKKLLAVVLAICMLSSVLAVVAACTQDLTQAKQTAITALETYAQNLKNQNAYSDENATLFDSTVSSAKDSINAAETQEDIDTALANARTALQAIEVDPLGTAVLTAKSTLDTTLASLKSRYTYTDAESSRLDTIVANGKAELESLLDADVELAYVTSVLNTIISDLNKVQGARNRFTNVGYSSSISHQWNPHTYESSEEGDLFAYITIGLYEFVLNETKDGYDIIPEMAAEMAVDVTDQYVGQYGVKEGQKGKVWKVALNQAAKWENGDAITADDYIFSMKALLNSSYKNYRASAFTSSDGELFNAAYYNKQDRAGTTDWQPIHDADDEEVVSATEKELYIVWDESHPWIEGSVSELLDTLASYGGQYETLANAVRAFRNGEEATTRIDNNAGFQAAVAAAFGDNTFGASGWETVAFYSNGVIPVVTWDQVGFFKTGDYEITFAFTNELEEFYLYYGALSFPFLVHEETYNNCLTETDGLWTSSYYTSMATTISYGPYKMSEYQMDRRIAWTVNENWYGWTDGKHEGKYQTTDITIDVVANQATAFNMFLQGKFDSVSLVSSQVTKYRSGPNTIYTPSTNTWKFTFNSSKEALKKREETGINKTLLSYSDFRKAIGLCIDKEEFVAQNFPASKPGFGLINNLYVYDYTTGAKYRDSEIAKQVLVEYYGLEYGEGKEYATLDEAYAAMTGYSKTQALELFRKAFADAKAAGDYKDGDVVTLEMLMYSSDQTYIDVFNFAFDSIKEVIKGTELEGKIVLVRNGNGGEEFYEVMKAGGTDIIMSAWGGGQFDPFGTICCYLDPDLYSLAEYGANISKSLTLTINETEYTMSLTNWSKALNSSVEYNGSELSFKTADFDTRLYILAQLEKAFLDLNAVVPLWYVTGASMHSYKINYGTDTYVNLVGFGGLREMTYNYNDAEWAEWVASQLSNADSIDYTQKPTSK